LRLLSLGATAAILIAACSSGGAAPSASSAAPSESAAASESASASASAGGGSKDYTACVAFDTGGLGDKNFNDLAKKGLEDAAAAGYTTFFSEAQGATDYAANIQRLVDQGCQSIVTVGFL
jgi:basic membrane protein A